MSADNPPFRYKPQFRVESVSIRSNITPHIRAFIHTFAESHWPAWHRRYQYHAWAAQWIQPGNQPTRRRSATHTGTVALPGAAWALILASTLVTPLGRSWPTVPGNPNNRIAGWPLSRSTGMDTRNHSVRNTAFPILIGICKPFRWDRHRLRYFHTLVHITHKSQSTMPMNRRLPA